MCMQGWESYSHSQKYLHGGPLKRAALFVTITRVLLGAVCVSCSNRNANKHSTEQL